MAAIAEDVELELARQRMQLGTGIVASAVGSGVLAAVAITAGIAAAGTDARQDLVANMGVFVAILIASVALPCLIGAYFFVTGSHRFTSRAAARVGRVH